MCDHPLRQAWVEALGSQYESSRQEYVTLRKDLSKVSNVVGIAIRKALNLQDHANSAAGDRSAPSVAINHPYYYPVGNREKLRRILAAFSMKHRYLGYDDDITMFAAMVLPVMEDEKSSFGVLCAIYERLGYEDFLMPDLCETPGDSRQRRMTDEADLVLAAFRDICPGAMLDLIEHNCIDQVRQMIGSWIRTCFTAGFSRERQGFEEFGPFLTRIITASPDSGDKRAHLRYYALCVLITNAVRITKASADCKLQEELQELALHIPVGKGLLQIMDERLEPDRSIMFHRLSWLPFGMAAGWCGALHLSTLTATSILGLGPLGIFVGGVVSCRMAVKSGYASIRESFESVVGMAEGDIDANGVFVDRDKKPAQFTDSASQIEPGDSASQIRTRQTTQSALSGNEGPQEDRLHCIDEAASQTSGFEPDLDFFLQGRGSVVGPNGDSASTTPA
eukprot:gb/GFBE01047540.1/.p1 GENE.gb/GFBE01047540.1/~~gb/GFBE01047540.1/.p1  ORF type:complete len:450 (+),score=80.85 gb/GFBE01047540.1/:1-1350(+)